MIRSTFVFCSLASWTSEIFSLAVKNHGIASYTSLFLTGGAVASKILMEDSWFGTTYFVLVMIHLTLFANAAFGILKNSRKASIFFALAQKHVKGTKEYRLNIRRWRNHKFDIKKTYFVFFKSLAFLSYLLVVKALTSDHPEGGSWEIQALSIGTEILIRVPIALFWYYEFKSIGENSEYIFGQKASIFKIVEGIFEPRIFKLMGSKTPSDGHDNFNPPTPPVNDKEF